MSLSWTFKNWTDEITWKHWKNITKNKNSENTPIVEITEVVSGFNNYHKIAISDHIVYHNFGARDVHGQIPKSIYQT